MKIRDFNFFDHLRWNVHVLMWEEYNYIYDIIFLLRVKTLLCFLIIYLSFLKKNGTHSLPCTAREALQTQRKCCLAVTDKKKSLTLGP